MSEFYEIPFKDIIMLEKSHYYLYELNVLAFLRKVVYTYIDYGLLWQDKSARKNETETTVKFISIYW